MSNVGGEDHLDLGERGEEQRQQVHILLYNKMEGAERESLGDGGTGSSLTHSSMMEFWLGRN